MPIALSESSLQTFPLLFFSPVFSFLLSASSLSAFSSLSLLFTNTLLFNQFTFLLTLYFSYHTITHTQSISSILLLSSAINYQLVKKALNTNFIQSPPFLSFSLSLHLLLSCKILPFFSPSTQSEPNINSHALVN